MVRTPLKKMEKSPSTAILYLFLMIFSYGLIQIYLLSDISLSLWLIYTTNALFLLSTIFFLFTWLRDPGYIKTDNSLRFNEILERFNPNHLCPDCRIIRTERSRHCNICNRCVERYDHHCPWINNCVGVKNHGTFFFYVLFTVLYIIFVFFLSSKVLYYSFHLDAFF